MIRDSRRTLQSESGDSLGSGPAEEEGYRFRGRVFAGCGGDERGAFGGEGGAPAGLNPGDRVEGLELQAC